jgi:hypothetical protein
MKWAERVALKARGPTDLRQIQNVTRIQGMYITIAPRTAVRARFEHRNLLLERVLGKLQVVRE